MQESVLFCGLKSLNSQMSHQGIHPSIFCDCNKDPSSWMELVLIGHKIHIPYPLVYVSPHEGDLSSDLQKSQKYG